MNIAMKNAAGLAVALSLCVCAACVAHADPRNCYWTGAACDGLWSSEGNWNPRVPLDMDLVYFNNAGTCRIDLSGVDVSLTAVCVGGEGVSGNNVTFVGGRVAVVASSSKIFPGNSLTVEGGSFVNNSTVYLYMDGGLHVRAGGYFETIKLNVSTNSVFELDHSSATGRLSMDPYATFRMTPGSEFKTQGGRPEAYDTDVFDVTGGRYVVGSNTQANYFSNCVKFPNQWGFADKLDEFVVEYASGGRMCVGKLANSSLENISWVNETVFKMEGGAAGATVTNQLLKAVPTPGLARSVEIAPGTEAILQKDSDARVQFLARNLVLGAGSTTVLQTFSTVLASYGSSSLDPTAAIRICVDESSLNASYSGRTFPVLMGAPDGQDISASMFSIEPQLSAGSPWHVACVGPFAYLTDGTTPDATTSGCWTGNGGDANWSTSGNWVGSAGNAPTFAGEKRTRVNVDEDNVNGKAFRFNTSCAAPFIIESDCGKVITVNRSATAVNNSSSSIWSGSRYPVVFRLPVTMSAADSAGTVFAVCSDGGDNVTPSSVENATVGYVAFMDSLNLGSRTFSFCGEVMIGGTATVGSLCFYERRINIITRATALHVLRGGSLTVGSQAHEINVPAAMFVEGGGTLTFAGGAFTYSTEENEHVVDGLLDIQAPFSGSEDISFTGTGVVNVARAVAPSSGSSVVRLSGGVTLKAAAWETDRISLQVPVGETASIFVEDGATCSFGDLIAVGRDAKLRKTGPGPLNFSSPASVDGAVEVQSGTIGVVGALKEATANGYVDVLTAADIVGDIHVPKGYAMRIAKTPAGLKVLRMRAKKGVVVVVF